MTKKYELVKEDTITFNGRVLDRIEVDRQSSQDTRSTSQAVYVLTGMVIGMLGWFFAVFTIMWTLQHNLHFFFNTDLSLLLGESKADAFALLLGSISYFKAESSASKYMETVKNPQLLEFIWRYYKGAIGFFLLFLVVQILARGLIGDAFKELGM